MSAGCFSWCRLLKRWGAKKQSTETKLDEKLPENRLANVPATRSVENRVMEPKSDEKLSENTRAVVPTTTEYITASGKQALKLLESAARIIPVPLLKDTIEVVLKIIEICDEASAIEQKVKELQDRLCHLMVVIVENVTAKNEEGSEQAVVKAAKGIERDLKDLLSILKTIDTELTEVRDQNRWLTGLYTDLNTSPVEGCLSRLSSPIEKFQLADDLRDSALLQELYSRLGKIHGLTQKVADKVDVVHEDVKDIKQILAQTERSASLLPSDTLTRQQMPLKPEIFHGRDGVCEEIAHFLTKEETSRVCILGPGGMGKTSVSLAVVGYPLVQERFPPGNRVWVPCIEATSATLLLEILYAQLQVPGEKQVTLEKIISELDTSKEPRLILFDNFETPWNVGDGNQKQVEDIIRQLSKLKHIAIVITMRGNYPPCNHDIKWQSKNIEPTDEEACLRIYHDNNPSSKDDPDVSRLLNALGHMPFAVTLMANLGKECQSTAKDLLEAWFESGPDILSDNPEQSMNRSISLSVESDLVKQDPNALLLLAILSLLPAGTTKENLRWWAPALKSSAIPSAIATLSKSALLVENKRQDSNSPVLFVVPVVQSFMQQHDRIAEEIRKQIHSSCCQYVLDHACRYDDPTFPAKSKALAAEDTNIQSILFSSPTIQHPITPYRAMDALIAFSWHRCDTKPNLEIANLAVTAAEGSGIGIHRPLAVWCLGWSHFHLGDFDFAYDHLQQAYQLFNALPLGDLESERLAGQCGIDLAHAARLTPDNRGEAVSLARHVERKCASLLDDLVHGRSLVALGAALAARRPQEALVHLDRARTMLTAVGNTANLALSEACQIISRVHYREQRLPEALAAIEEAWKYVESSDSPSDQAYISLEFSKILFSTDRGSEAWKYLEIALMKGSYLGNRLVVAQALERIGYGHLLRGDYQNAYGAYEAAASEYRGTLNSWVEERCKDNMARIQEKQRNPDAFVGFRRHGMDVDQSLFYPPIQVPAGEVPNSGS